MSEPVVANDQETWRAYWREHGQPWRTEPEIDTGRQYQLTTALEMKVDIEQSLFTFICTSIYEWISERPPLTNRSGRVISIIRLHI